MGNAATAKKIMMRGALMPGAQCTHSLACDVKWHTYVITTGSDRSTGIPRSAVRENPGFDFKQPILRRHCEEPTGRANARPMTGSATKQSILPLRGEMDCFASLAMTACQFQPCLRIPAARGARGFADVCPS